MGHSRRRPLRPPLAEWVYAGHSGLRVGALLRSCVMAALRLVRATVPERVHVQRWIRYYIDLTGTLPPVPPDVRLTQVTDDIIDMLGVHREAAESGLRSGLHFWDRGLRRAYVWLGDNGPLCIQWLLTSTDLPRRRHLGDWAGMYPPLERDTAHVENLFAFERARQDGLANRFEYALYHEARRLGLSRLVTHMYEPNTAMRAWAEEAGWRRYGTITRYQVDLPGLRNRSVYLHRHERAYVASPGLRPGLVTPAPLH